MSGGLRIPPEEAWPSARRLRELLYPTDERWTIAGSLRRARPDVGDIEHVVIPGTNTLRVMDGLVDPGGLFADPSQPLQKAVKSDGSTRWGNRYRAVVFQGREHEIFFTTPERSGATLAIRTGPPSLSRHCVTVCRDRGLECKDGGLRYIRDGSVYATPEEEDFFRACGVEYVPPEERDALAERLAEGGER